MVLYFSVSNFNNNMAVSIFCIIFVIGIQKLNCRYLRVRNLLFKRLDIPGPEPLLLVGNLLDFQNISGVQKKSAGRKLGS